MAVATVETIIANPAGKRRGNVARKFGSLKQKLHFGTKKQRAAAAQSLKRSRAAKRAASHRKGRTNAGPLSRRKAKKRLKSWTERMRKRGIPIPRSFASETVKRRAHKRQHNPGEIIALTTMNPAKRGRSMAKTVRHKKRRASSHSAGSRRSHHRMQPARRHHVTHHRRRTHNPGRIGALVGDATAVGVGFFGSKIATQAVMGANNTGLPGYFGNAIATGALSLGANMFGPFKKYSFMIAVGGVLNILSRIVSDNSLLGQYSSQLGMGDYLIANWWVPQRLDGAPFSLTHQGYDMSWMPQPTIPIASGAPPGMGYLPAPIPNIYGNDLY